MKPLHALKFAIATAITLAVLNAACAFALAVTPDATIALFNSFMHGVDLSKLVPPGGRPITFAQVVGGIVAVGAIGFAAGGILAGLYNAMAAKGRDQSVVQTSRRSV